MDLVVLAGVKVKRNEVYFDRAALAPLVSAKVAAGAVEAAWLVAPAPA